MTMRVAQVSSPKGPFEIVERPIPPAAPGTVRIKVSACGICHSDALVKEGLWPGIQYPRVRVNQAYERMMSSKARFRVVLRMN